MGLRQANLISELTKKMGEPYLSLGEAVFEKQSRMLWMEGTFFLSLLTLGGSLLIWFSYRDIRRNDMIEDFFSTVTHEMKTPLAGIRIQVESILEDLGEKSPQSKSLFRALKESDRIESQMEKAFYLASFMRSEILFFENLPISEIRDSLKEYFPEVIWNISYEISFCADRKALECILKNLIENSYKHGQARKIKISIEKSPNKREGILRISDDGIGFQGSIRHLGKPFIRHSSTSGTGIGIYIVKGLVSRMKGSIRFFSDESGFHSIISLPLCDSKDREGR